MEFISRIATIGSMLAAWVLSGMLVPVPGLFAAADTLVEAARNGDNAAIETLLNEGADVNSAEADGSTALIWASYRDDVRSAEMLVRAGADVNRANDLGATALWAASENGNAAIVDLLLAAGADPDAALVSGETLIMVASRGGFPEVVERLVAAGADLDARATRDQTALMWAVAQQHPDVVEVLLRHGADLDARTEVWSQVMAVPPHGYLEYNRDIPHGSDTALMFAARVGDLDSMRLLVAAGANVNDADAWGVSAVTLAAHSGFGDMVRFLLENGADPNAPGPGFTALHEAIMRRDESMVRGLLAHGADANTPLETWTPTRRSSDDFNFTPELVGAPPFWLAARFAEPGIMRLLVENGADPLVVHRGSLAAATPEGVFELRTEETTALMAALGMGGGRAWVEAGPGSGENVLEAVRLLIEWGVDVNAANTNGRTALDAANDDRVVEVLVQSGARPGTGDRPRRSR